MSRQYQVTRENATEPTFDNEYGDHHAAGIDVHVAPGGPPFTSTAQYDSGCGRPSFTGPHEPANATESIDVTLAMIRTELGSLHADSHRGRGVDDGPTAEDGRRHCINSAALRFVGYEELGEGEYRHLFEDATSEGTQ